MKNNTIFLSIAFSVYLLIFVFPATAQEDQLTDTCFCDHCLRAILDNPDAGPQKDTGPGGYLFAQASTPPDNTEAVDDDDFDDDFDDEDTQRVEIADPLYYFNYAMYGFNDFFYLSLFEPLAKGYKSITPTPVRIGIKNFFHNLLFPVRFVSNILQFELSDACREVGIFAVNTTIGFLGFGQVAQHYYDWHTADEDLGQTLGRWGFDNGLYIVWPILGPSSLRDTIGMVGDSFLTPLNYVEPWELSTGIKGIDLVNSASFRIGAYSALVDSAIDPYEAIKDAYIQTRQGMVKE
jgi:phospholipid-binding lipoprotein MlaA